MKQISIKTSIYTLSLTHPEIVTIMKDCGFENITQPGMLQTAGRLMTIEKGAKMKGISLEFIQKIFRKNGYEFIQEEEK
ncbi:MAG: threonyl-tRNA synthetase [Bacillales bacterium]|jgi:hypothetical protein|nr:threonyl-tRNA synthetase [Bacillales bacterium]